MWAVGLALLATVPAQKHLPVGYALLVVLAACLLAGLLVGASCVHWLKRASRVASRPQRAAALARLRAGRTGRRLLWSCVLGIVALVLVGGGIVVTTAPADGTEPSAYGEISLYAFFLGQIIAACAWVNVFGVPWANWAAATAVGVSAVLWLAHGTAFGTAMAAVSLGLAGVGAWRGVRYAVGPGN